MNRGGRPGPSRSALRDAWEGRRHARRRGGGRRGKGARPPRVARGGQLQTLCRTLMILEHRSDDAAGAIGLVAMVEVFGEQEQGFPQRPAAGAGPGGGVEREGGG